MVNATSITWLCVGGVMGLALLAEVLHARHLKRPGVARLAFGPEGRGRGWTAIAPFVRVVALGLLTWGLITLYVIDPKVAKPKKVSEKDFKRLLVVLDVSPSMHLSDAGPLMKQTRAKRAAEIVMSVLDRIVLDQTRVSVVCFYNGAKPVVVDAKDPAVIRNILADLPLDQAFDHGKTKLFDGLREAANIARPWREKSTTVILASDGDTVPDAGMPEMPRSVAKVLVVGVGDARAGKFIDGHTSRQDVSTLRQVANRLRGMYHDGNEKHLPSEMIASLAEAVDMVTEEKAGKREMAIAAVAAGAAMMALLPVMLAVFGTRWRVGRLYVQERAGVGGQALPQRGGALAATIR